MLKDMVMKTQRTSVGRVWGSKCRVVSQVNNQIGPQALQSPHPGPLKQPFLKDQVEKVSWGQT